MAAVTGMVTWRGFALRRQQSHEALRQLTQQTTLVMGNELPQVLQEIQQVDVDISKAFALLPSIENQVATVRKIASSDSLAGADRALGESRAIGVEKAFANLSARVSAVEQLVKARLHRFEITEEAFQFADGLPVVYGRDGIITYRQVITELAGGDILSGTVTARDSADKLRSHAISEHLRMALDDWFILSYRPEEVSVRERLV